MDRPAPKSTPSGLFSVASLLIVSAAVTIAVVAVLAGQAFPLVLRALMIDGSIVAIWLAAAMGIGRAILRVTRFDAERALRIVLATTLGLGVIGLVVLGFGLAGWLNRWTSILILAAGVVALVISLLKRDPQRWAFLYRSAGMHWIALLAAPTTAIALAGATIPPGILWGDEPAGYDVTEYHLQVPREWFEAGRITPLQHNVFSYMPFNVEMHYLLAIHLRGGPWNGMYCAQLMHVAFVMLSAAAIYALLANKYPRGAIIAATLAMATPWMTLLAPMAYNEGGLLLFGTLAIGLAIRSIDEAQPVKWMLMAGAMAGFACGSKLTAGPAILLPVPIVVLVARGMSRVGWKSAIVFCIAGVVTFSPWLIRNAVWTRNPLFPEATSVFGKAHWSDTQVQRWIKANHLPRLEQQNVGGRLHAGWDQVAGDPRFGYLLIPFALIVVIARRDRQTMCLFALLLFQAIFWLFFTHLQSRFFVLSIPICALIISGLKSKEWLIASTAVTLVVAASGIVFAQQKLEGIQQRVKVSLFGFSGVEQAMGLQSVPTETDAKQVELIGEGQAFLCDVPMSRLHYRTVFDVDARPGESSIDAWRRGWPTGDDVITDINPDELMRFHRTYWGIPEP